MAGDGAAIPAAPAGAPGDRCAGTARPRVEAAALRGQVRTALARLHDLPALQRHPLAGRGVPAAGPLGAGKTLHRALVEATGALRPARPAPASRAAAGRGAARRHRLLELRYLEALPVAEVQRRLAIGRSEYFREHQWALEAVAAVLRERWGAAGPGASAGPGAPAAPGTAAGLPVELTSFVGRERELAAVTGLLATTRLLTLTGTGGTGKTRLALRLGADLLGAAGGPAGGPYPDGVWFVDLAPLADAALVPATALAALGAAARPGQPPEARLVEHLRPRRVLLLLDNCEHLLDACARLADALLRACPHLTVLATSREALGIAGETAWRVPSLGVPEVAAGQPPPPAEAVARSEAGRLFVDRARAVLPAFEVTDRNAPAVARVCARLDGIPLALELAAARVRVLPVEQLLARLEDRFRLLTGGGRTAPARHQTLRAAVDWSHALLTAPERRLFARLAVFAGGFSLEAAEAVGAGEGVAAGEVLDLLTRLVDQSLVATGAEPPADGAASYRLLETLRAYARERLEASGEAAAARARHAAFYSALAEAAWRGGAGEAPVPPVWPGRLAAAHDNVRAALAWYREAGDTERGLRLATAQFGVCGQWAPLGEGRRWLDALLAAGPAPPPAVWAAALFVAGNLAHYQGDYARAQDLHEAAVAARRELGDLPGAAHALQSLGFDLWLTGDAGRAVALMEESLAVFRAHDSRFAVSRSLRDLGLVACSRGQYRRAAALLEESVAAGRAAGRPAMVARGQALLGRVAYLQGDHDRARRWYLETLPAPVRPGAAANASPDWLDGVAAVAGARGQPELAARLFGAAEALRRELGTVRYAPERPAYDRDVAAGRARLSEEAFAGAWAAGRAMPLEQALAQAARALGWEGRPLDVLPRPPAGARRQRVEA